MEPAPENKPQTRREDLYVLVVDDDPDSQEIMTAMIHLFQLRVKAVSNGASALEMVAADPPALILLDLMMPDMTGFEVLKHLKANPHTRSIPVIILSALGDDQRLIRLGASRVIPKGSYTVERLRKSIEECLALPRPRTP